MCLLLLCGPALGEQPGTSQEVDSVIQDAHALYVELHQHPELSAHEVLTAARLAKDHRRMVLDTLGTMTAARDLHATLGFKRIPAYYNNPIQGVTYLARDLLPRQTADSVSAR